MSAADSLTVGKAINDYVARNPSDSYETIVNAVADELNVSKGQVIDEVEKLEQEGFVYLIESGDTTEVKVA